MNVYLCHCCKTLKSFIVFFLIFFYSAFSQETSNWINQSARELKLGLTQNNVDLFFLEKEVADKKVIGLGEASHGSHEFYILKARIIQHLVNKCGFRLIALECTQTSISAINSYLGNGKGNLKLLMKDMGLYSTEELYDFFVWLRQYNIQHVTDDRVTVIGLDSEEYWHNAITRDKFMADNLIKSYNLKKGKAMIWAHNVHLMKDSASLSMGSHLNKQLGDKFYSIGFDTYKGTVNVLNNGIFEIHTFQADKSSFSNTLAQAKYSSFYLPFRKESPLNGAKVFITNIYSSWRKPKPISIKLGGDFDSMIFIRNTSFSRRLNLQ
jgi:erythromycin esterase-like protein